MTISGALWDSDKIPPWKEKPLVWKYNTFKWKVKGRNETCIAASSGNDLKSKWSISGMHHHLMVWQVKWNISFKKETWLKKSSLVMPYSAQKMTQMCWKVAISPTKVRRLVYACVQRKEGLQRLTVERIQNTSLHRWLTPYKCLSLCLHAHPAAGTIVTC